jgi:hypothetical protein
MKSVMVEVKIMGVSRSLSGKVKGAAQGAAPLDNIRKKAYNESRKGHYR